MNNHKHFFINRTTNNISTIHDITKHYNSNRGSKDPIDSNDLAVELNELYKEILNEVKLTGDNSLLSLKHDVLHMYFVLTVDNFINKDNIYPNIVKLTASTTYYVLDLSNCDMIKKSKTYPMKVMETYFKNRLNKSSNTLEAIAKVFETDLNEMVASEYLKFAELCYNSMHLLGHKINNSWDRIWNNKLTFAKLPQFIADKFSHKIIICGPTSLPPHTIYTPRESVLYGYMVTNDQLGLSKANCYRQEYINTPLIVQSMDSYNWDKISELWEPLDSEFQTYGIEYPIVLRAELPKVIEAILKIQ